MTLSEGNRKPYNSLYKLFTFFATTFCMPGLIFLISGIITFRILFLAKALSLLDLSSIQGISFLSHHLINFSFFVKRKGRITLPLLYGVIFAFPCNEEKT